MFGNLGNLAGMMKSAKDLQQNMSKLQEELVHRRYEGDAGAGIVHATVDGKGNLLKLKIDPKATEDIELLEDMIIASVGAATAKSQEAFKSEVASLTGGINIPGLTDMFTGSGGPS